MKMIKHFLALIFLVSLTQFAFAQVPQVQSANIMDVQKDAETGVEAQRERVQTQPGNNAPFWRSVNSDEAHYVSIPKKEAGVLIQKSGQQWRLLRNGVITVFGGWMIVLAAVGILVFYFFKGPMKLDQPPTGKKYERFTALERLVHWTMAYSFLALAVTGLFIIFGKHLVMPVIGHSLYGIILYVFKNIHNIVGPLFTVSILVFFVMFVKDNIPNKTDIAWIKVGGGAFGHADAGRFNFGEKMWFWIGMTGLGFVVAGSGWVLDMIVPGLEYWRGTMQIANVIHVVAAIFIMIFAMGHIYIGTIGTEGALEGMKTGYSDESWAKQHHGLWVADIDSGKIPASREPENSALSNAAKKIVRTQS
jgi:formate dehydrogenase subunit gamma